MQQFWHTHKSLIFAIFLSIVAMLGVYALSLAGKGFMASLLGVKEPAPFDGTALPIQQVPNWTTLSGSDSLLTADALAPTKLMALPTYAASAFSATVADLNWKTQKEQVNQILTYSTPYMGTYSGSSAEYEGSHLAVDIRAPVGTPVYAIANGKVTKVAQSGAGFGIHIVIEHPAVPLLAENTTETLYSSYSHLSQAQVIVGDIVTRGQQIALSGNTGTSTGAHLHFQIDRESAPWHPWWPFSSAEASAAGLDFFSGINAGLGKEAAIKNTINPMLWVQQYLSTAPTVTPSTPTPTPSTTPTETPAPTPTPTETPTPAPTLASASFDLSGDSFALVGNSANILLTAKDTNGNTLSSFSAPERIVLSAKGGNAEVIPSILTAQDFTSGIAKVRVVSEEAAPIEVEAATSTATTTTKVTFISTVKPVAKFSVTLPETATIGDQTVTITALDDTGTPTPNPVIGGTVQLALTAGTGTFAPATLTQSDFVQGVATTTLRYTGGEAPFSVTAREGSLFGESEKKAPSLFTDVGTRHQFQQSIRYLKEKGFISGYPDGTFRPDATVSRVEALKILTGALGITVPASAQLTFPDTDSSAWYARFIQAALTEKVVSGYPDGSFKPAATVNRAEYLKMLTLASRDQVPGVHGKPYPDVEKDSWFAPYAQYAATHNLTPDRTKLDATRGMTRGEVAETIYRLLMVKKYHAVSYDETLTP